ncbi:MAG: dehydrogenase [Saprospiraceae bacterium]
MIYRAKAPLRIGLAGGGTDVSPYADLHGGAILNATVSLFASASISLRDDNLIILDSRDLGERVEVEATEQLEIDGQLDLLKGVYNRLVRDFNLAPQGFTLITEVDAPKGSGMGTSSTVTVAVLGAFAEWLKLPLGEYDVARLAYDIERIDLGMSGGRQDQYAATFGGFNYMEFYADEKVIVNPLRVRRSYQKELEHNILLYYTGTSRLSAKIIDQQQEAFAKTGPTNASIDAAHALKEQAVRMKEAVLTGQLNAIGELLDFGWQHKKKMAAGITNAVIDELYDAALAAGATGGKISGAGGGGFMTFYCPGQTRHAVAEALNGYGGELRNFVFVNEGMMSWVG